MSKRLPIDPLYHVKARSLKRSEARRVQRNTLQPFNRATLWPVEAVRVEQHQRRVLAALDIAFFVVMLIVAVCLVAVVLRA